MRDISWPVGATCLPRVPAFRVSTLLSSEEVSDWASWLSNRKAMSSVSLSSSWPASDPSMGNVKVPGDMSLAVLSAMNNAVAP